MAITQYIFREQGNPDGLFQDQPLKSELILHIAAFVSWDLRGPLLFNNDDQWTNETILKAYKQAKPRRRPKLSLKISSTEGSKNGKTRSPGLKNKAIL
jgi:hypothetical protein